MFAFETPTVHALRIPHSSYQPDNMDDSDGSLSSAGSEEIKKLAPIFKKAKAATKIRFPPPVVSPPRPKRAPSPPHETVLADNPDIAVRNARKETRS